MISIQNMELLFPLLIVFGVIIIFSIVFITTIRIILFTPFIMLLIFLETKIGPYIFFFSFPRNSSEIYNYQNTFFSFLVKYGVLPKESALKKIYSNRSLKWEPKKNKTISMLTIEYIVKDNIYPLKLDLFIKFQSGRGMPLWLQSARIVTEGNVCREIDFYNKVSSIVPIQTPKCFIAVKNFIFNRVCVVSEYVDGLIVPDYIGLKYSQFQIVLKEISKMHATFWDKRHHYPQLSWIPARSGIDFMLWISSFLKNESDIMRKIWNSIIIYFSSKKVTLVHGDCRPGNIIFKNEEIIFTDFEAINIAPSMWDVTYLLILGQSSSDFQKQTPSLLSYYHSLLIEHNIQLEYSLDDVNNDFFIMCMVLYYLGYVIYVHKLWNEQGNSKDDSICWEDRIFFANNLLDNYILSDLLNVTITDIETWKYNVSSQNNMLER